MNILQYQEVEIGDRVRVILQKKLGIECTPIFEGRRMAHGFSFTDLHYSLYSYVRTSNGQTVWLIEVEIFSPPDAQIWRSWVVDAEPSAADVERIIAADAQAGGAP